ncbi:MAG: TM2 domain-containing protein [Eubacteriales bacterium]|nr:TM2 domain-containing protein [Eubacteriales bacterium]
MSELQGLDPNANFDSGTDTSVNADANANVSFGLDNTMSTDPADNSYQPGTNFEADFNIDETMKSVEETADKAAREAEKAAAAYSNQNAENSGFTTRPTDAGQNDQFSYQSDQGYQTGQNYQAGQTQTSDYNWQNNSNSQNYQNSQNYGGQGQAADYNWQDNQNGQYYGGQNYSGQGYQDGGYGNPQDMDPFPPGAKIVTMEKNLHTWLFAFLLGAFGVDRFIRGQIGLGIAKLLLNWGTFGIWALVDWIIAIVEAYSKDHFGNDRDFVFIDGKYAK